jgi:hypothetical protein
VGGILAEILQLRVGQGFAGDTHQQDQCAQIVLQPRRGIGKPRRDENRKHQRDRSKPLVLQEGEHPARRIHAPFPGEGGVARVVANDGGSHGDVHPQPQRPDRDQGGDQPLPCVRRGAG